MAAAEEAAAVSRENKAFCLILRELVFYDRNPESMRTVPRVCAAGCDSVNRIRRILRLCPWRVVLLWAGVPKKSLLGAP